MKKLIVLLMLLPCLVSAQTYEDDKKPRIVFEMIHCINLIKTNDGTEPIKFDSCAYAVAQLLLVATVDYLTNDVHYFPSTGTRMVRNDTITLPFVYLNGDIGRKPAGPLICIASRDEKSFIVVGPTLGLDRRFFKREEINPMAVYQGSATPKIEGVMPDLDVKTLCELVPELLPSRNYKEKMEEN